MAVVTTRPGSHPVREKSRNCPPSSLFIGRKDLLYFQLRPRFGLIRVAQEDVVAAHRKAKNDARTAKEIPVVTPVDTANLSRCPFSRYCSVEITYIDIEDARCKMPSSPCHAGNQPELRKSDPIREHVGREVTYEYQLVSLPRQVSDSNPRVKKMVRDLLN